MAPVDPPTQRPAEQVSPVAQGLKHAPQLAGSALVSTHDEPHMRRGEAQLVRHMPPLHARPAGQGLSQMPQWLLSVSVFTHDPPHWV